MDSPTQAASGFIEAMKSQPLALALVVMNLALLALFYVIVQSAEARHKANGEQLKTMLELLAHCRGTQ